VGKPAFASEVGQPGIELVLAEVAAVFRVGAIFGALDLVGEDDFVA
jgi:hypothetical protein